MRTRAYPMLSVLLLAAALVGSPVRAAEAPRVMPARADAAAVATAGAAAIGLGSNHLCAVLSDGRAACWGANEYGQSQAPEGSVAAVDSGEFHSCAIRVDQTLTCWGDNGNGQAAPPAGSFTRLSAGYFSNCAIRSDETLACWGWNGDQQATPPSGTFTDVTAGRNHSCAVRTDGTAQCWGFNGAGQATAPSGTFVAVDAGSEFSCGIRTNGTLSCWGSDGAGQGTPPTGTFASVSASVNGGHACAIRTDGTLACWGNNDYGQATPPTGTYTTVSAGWVDTCAVRSDGAIACWGGNWYGQQNAVMAIPSGIAFGSVLADQAAPTQDVTLSNLSAADAAVVTIGFSGTNASDFTIAAETCTSVPVIALGACTVTVGFTPAALGGRSAILTITGPAPVGTLAVPVSGTGFRASSGVTWGSRVAAGPAYTWNAGNAFARTVQSGTQRLHLAYATDRISGSWARDTGPYAGVYYIRSSSGSSWSTPKRLNPSTQHAIRSGLAASGSRVYVAWASQTRLYNYSPTAPRVLYVRVNTGYGASKSWKSTVRLTSTSGRVDWPTVAATGYDAYVAWTNSNTGDILLAYTHDRGATWHKTTIGTTTAGTTSGKGGHPSVAANGATVAVSWIGANTGSVKTRSSFDRGAHWGTTSSVDAGSNGGLSTAASGDRVAVAWTTADDVVVSQSVGGVWQAPRTIATLPVGEAPAPYGPVVTLQASSRIGLSWSVETSGSGSRSDLMWAESADAGAHWYATQRLFSGASSSTRRLNDWPSVAWPVASTRYVVWNGWTSGTNYYRLFLRKGSGAPAGATTAAVVWTTPSGQTSGESLTPTVGAGGRGPSHVGDQR